MQQLHKVTYRISDIERYRKYLYERTDDGEILHHKEIKECGGELQDLKEESEGLYKMEIIVDPEHPKFNDLGAINKRHGFSMELIGIPEVKCIGMSQVLNEALTDMDKALEQVA